MVQHFVRVDDPGDRITQRMVLVDDTNPNVQYSGPWFAVQDTQTHLGNLGIPFQNTLHGVNVNATLSFPFSGSSVTVLGTSMTNNASGTQDPTWECFVDNNSIGSSAVLQLAENNWPFCQSSQLKDGPHVLTVKASVANQRNTFWFDQIQYLPSSNASLDQLTLRIDSSDSAIQYGSGWHPLDGGLVNYTQTAGSTLTYPFSGVSVSLLGFIPGANFPLKSSSATYSVDGQSPINFVVPGLSSPNASQLFHQVLFTTGQLSAGQHQLVVTHQGNVSAAPLALDYFVLQTGPLPSGSSSTGSTPTSSSSSISSTTKKAIIGGVVGGTILLLLLLFILFLFIRRRKNKNRGKPDDSHDIVDAFTAPTLTLAPQLIDTKFKTTDRPTAASNVIPRLPPTDTGPSMPALPALRHPNPSLPVIISPPSPQPPTNVPDGTTTRGPEAETAYLTKPSAVPPRGDGRFLRHEDSGIRMPAADDEPVELPPFYTSG